MTAFLVSKVQRERELAHLCGIRPCDARKSMGPCRLSPSIASSYPDEILSLLPSIMSASWARLGCVFSRWRYWMLRPCAWWTSTRDNCCLNDED